MLQVQMSKMVNTGNAASELKPYHTLSIEYTMSRLSLYCTGGFVCALTYCFEIRLEDTYGVLDVQEQNLEHLLAPVLAGVPFSSAWVAFLQ